MTVVSVNDVILTQNPRYSVKKEVVEENIVNWKLVIHNVKKQDEGFYECLINTDPAKTRDAYLEVTSKQLINVFYKFFQIIIHIFLVNSVISSITLTRNIFRFYIPRSSTKR